MTKSFKFISFFLILICLTGCSSMAGGQAQQPKEKKEVPKDKLERKIEKVEKPKVAAEPSLKDRLQTILLKYSNNKGVQMKLRRKVVNSLLGNTKKHSGELKISSGKLRMELKGDEDALLVMDGKNIWYENRFKEFGGRIQVSKMQSGQAQKSSAFLAVLFDPKNQLKRFKVEQIKEIKDANYFRLVPVDEKKSEIKKLELKVANDSEIRIIRYWDSLDNETEYAFKNISFDKDFNSSLFSYIVPEGAEVVNY